MSITLARGSRARAFVIAIAAIIVAASTIDVLAHRVLGQRDPTGHTALVQSPTANTDVPVPIYNTGLSVICMRLTNTSQTDTDVTGIGLELPGELSGFSLVSPLDRGLSLHEDVKHVPGFPDVTLDFAVVTGPNLPGWPRHGIRPNAPPMTICVGGPFDATVAIETMLNNVFVAFRGGKGFNQQFDIGVWERR